MIEAHLFEISITLIIVVGFLLLRTFVHSLVRRHEQKYDLNRGRSVYVIKFLNFFVIFFLVLGIFAIWNVEAKSLLVYFGSFFAITGAAFFAQWSILSNVTASILIFFNYPFKIGSRIKIMDKDDSVEGIVEDITFFTLHLKQDDGNLVYYPNTSVIQKGIVEILQEKDTNIYE
jgi:MscS family membrane protein